LALFLASFTGQFCAGLFVPMPRAIVVQAGPDFVYGLAIAKLTFQNMQVVRATHTSY